MKLSLAEVSDRVAGTLEGGDSDTVICGVAPLESAGPDQVSLVASARYLSYVHATRAAAVLVSDALSAELPAEVARIRVPDPHVALARLLAVLHPEPPVQPGIHATAVFEPGVQIGEDVTIGPYAVIGADTRIGDRCRVGAHTVIGAGCTLGADTLLDTHVTLYRGVKLGQRCIVHSGARLGSDGFGYVWENGGHRKVPQVGGCLIGDDVEIGANVTIDRGSIGDTVVGRGTKIDNLCQIGHNVRIGEDVIIVAQVGISGSTTVGNGAVLGGQAGLGGHLTIGAGARVGAQAGVTGDVAPEETVSGYPARPHRNALRASAALQRLPKLVERIGRIERAVFPNAEK